MKPKLPELILPAGTPEKLRVAFAFGADAVYAGLPALSLRARNTTFTNASLASSIEYAHKIGRKVYVTVNIFPHETDLAKIPRELKELCKMKPDAVIFSDSGVFRLLRKYLPKMKLHLSTQANTVNSESVKFWKSQGVSRIILARELNLKEIAKIHKAVPNMELEVFVHGDMCMAYSGRCLLSNFLANRDANRGMCAQPCRWKYHLVEEERPGEYMPIEEDQHGSYILNSKTLCLVDYLDELKRAGVSSFKVEGRAKSAYYLAIVAKAYRFKMEEDRLSFLQRQSFSGTRDLGHGRNFQKTRNFGSREDFQKALKFQVAQNLHHELNKTSNRGFTTGFLFGKMGAGDHSYETSAPESKQVFRGIVEAFDKREMMVRIKVRNEIYKGDTLEFIFPYCEKSARKSSKKRGSGSSEGSSRGKNSEFINYKAKISKVLNKNGKEEKSIHGGCENDILLLKTKIEIPKWTIVRKI